MRKLPVITFMNKLDRFGLDPLTLLDEVSTTLNLKVVPLNWPIGMGKDFKGVVDLRTKKVLLFEGARHGTQKAQSQIVEFEEAKNFLEEEEFEQVCEEIELLEMAGDSFTKEGFLKGEISPVFWGSALSNFGVEPLLEFLAQDAASPQPRETTESTWIEPTEERFTGFIFKVQANMNPRHRDRIAFMRVVSGRFSRGMEVRISRSNTKLKLAKPHSFLAQERSIVEEAFPGDIVGLYDPGKLRLGDTLTENSGIKFKGIPRFAPEFFARMVLKDPMRRKHLATGLEQLSQEGVIQLFYRPEIGKHDPYLGAVGMLQFEVLKERLLNEYNVKATIQSLPFQIARWVGGTEEGLQWLKERRDYPLLLDRNDQPVLLSESMWSLNFALQNAKGLELYDVEPL